MKEDPKTNARYAVKESDNGKLAEDSVVALEAVLVGEASDAGLSKFGIWN